MVKGDKDEKITHGGKGSRVQRSQAEFERTRLSGDVGGEGGGRIVSGCQQEGKETGRGKRKENTMSCTAENTSVLVGRRRGNCEAVEELKQKTNGNSSARQHKTMVI